MTINTKFKYLPITALVVAVSLAGCSSSDDDRMAAVDPETPVVEPETPVVEPETPVVEPETPVVEPETPVVEPETPAEPTSMELAETAYGEYETARTAFEVSQDTYNLSPTAANLGDLKAAAALAEMEANEALDLAADGSAPQLIRARAAVNAAEMASLHVVGIEMAIADAAALVTALGAAGTAATAYDVAKADYDAVDGMTQANLDALTECLIQKFVRHNSVLPIAA